MSQRGSKCFQSDWPFRLLSSFVCDATYQDDGPRQESTEDVDIGPLIEDKNFSCLRERRHRYVHSPHQIQSWDYQDWLHKHQQPPVYLCVCPWVTKSAWVVSVCVPDVAVTFLPIQMWRISRPAASD